MHYETGMIPGSPEAMKMDPRVFFSQTTDEKKELRRRSACISRKLRLLRAHALITKITGTHRYQLTSTGRKTIVAVLSALRSTVAQLTPVTAQLTVVAA